MGKIKLSGAIDSVFNETARAGAKKRAENIFLIPLEKIIRNPNNQYGIRDIDSLKFTIKKAGLKQPLEVMEIENGMYMLISGERRWTALNQIVEEKKEGYEKFLEVPCVITNVETDMNLPISKDLKERFSIVMTNKEIRTDKTDAELMFETETYAEVFEALKKDSKLAEELEKEGFIVSNQKRKFIAENMGISESTVQRLENINKNLIPPLKEKFIEGEIPVTVANNIAKLDEKEQKKIAKRESIKQADVDNLANKKKEEPIEPVENKKTYYDETIIDEKNLLLIQEKLEKIKNQLKDSVVLKKDDYIIFDTTLELIVKQLNKLQGVILKSKARYIEK